MLIKMFSWNVNGIRAISAKPDWQWFNENDAQIIGLQETKASVEQLKPELVSPNGWHSAWASSKVKKGYSGVASFSRIEPLAVQLELPANICETPCPEEYRCEGRLIHLEFEWFHFFTVYFPNGGASILNEKGKPTGEFKRVPYKMAFFDNFLAYAEKLRKTKPIVVCGDFNIAHKAIDLARPKQNETNTGYLPEERAWLDKFEQAGYVDTFRYSQIQKGLGEEEGHYSWWSYKAGARPKNVGWRIDYFFVSEELRGNIKDAWIENQVFGSDHCPVGLSLEI